MMSSEALLDGGDTFLVVPRGGVRDARPLSGQFVSFSCSFQPKSYQIIRLVHRPALEILDPPLGGGGGSVGSGRSRIFPRGVRQFPNWDYFAIFLPKTA